jgi:ABC-type transport system involved in multi-copper enzyme maturation permease subunit
VGPLFYYELVRLARRGRSTLLRCNYALALLLALFLAYRARFPEYDPWSRSFLPAKPLSAVEMSRLAEGFVYSIFWVQTLAVFVLAPVYLGSAVTEDRERGTLDLLRMTHLSAREIVLGKLFARAAHLGGVLLAGLPLLALAQLWGGVDFRLLLAVFLVSGLDLLSVGAISIAHSAMHRTTTLAILTSYAIAAGQLLSCTALTGTPAEIFRTLAEAMAGPAPVPGRPPVTPPTAGAVIFGPLVFCAVVNGIVFLCFMAVAVVRLYTPLGPPDEKTAPDNELSPHPGAHNLGVCEAPDDAPPPHRLRILPPVGDWPLLWKERNRGVWESAAAAVEQLFKRAPFSALLLVGAWAAMLFMARRVGRDNSDALQTMGVVARSAMVLLAGLWCATVAFFAAGGISGERDRQTLDALLTLPVSRASLLWAKWLGAVLGGRVFGYGLAVLAAVELVGGDWHPLGVLLLLLTVASHVALLSSLGTWLSLVSHSSLRARIAVALVLALSGGGLSWSFAALGASAPESWQTLAAGFGTNAPATWWFLAFTRDDFAAGGDVFVTRLGVAAVGVLFFASLAGAFWLNTWQRLETGRAR